MDNLDNIYEEYGDDYEEHHGIIYYDTYEINENDNYSNNYYSDDDNNENNDDII